MFAQESDIVKTMRLVEGLKAQLVSEVGGLYGALAAGDEKQSREALALVVAHCYALGKRLGINYGDLDQAVENGAERLAAQNGELENRFGDYSRFARHIRQKE